MPATRCWEPSSPGWILRDGSPTSINAVGHRKRIKASFDRLQQKLGEQIDETMTRTRQQLLENFDEEVHEKLRVNLENSRTYLNRYERLLMQLTQYELDGHAEFLEGESAFRLHSCPFPETEGIRWDCMNCPGAPGKPTS